MKSFAAIESKIFDMGLDCYAISLYVRIVLHARGSNIGHIESQENTAISLKCSKRQVIISLKILLEKNIIQVEKKWRRNTIKLVKEEFWKLSSSAYSSHDDILSSAPCALSSAYSAPDSHTLELTRSRELDVCKKTHTQKIKKPNFKTAGIALAEAIRKSFGDSFFRNEIAIEIVIILYAENISINEIEIITHDIERYRFLTSKLKTDIIEQMKNWPNQKSEFIAKKESNFVITEIKQEEIMIESKKEKINYLEFLPETFKIWLENENKIIKKQIEIEIKQIGYTNFVDKRIPNIYGYQKWMKEKNL